MGQQNSSARQLFRPDSLPSDPTAFRVFVKKRNKFIPGWLKINDDEIIFARSHQNYQSWPLAYLRRYGYTCSGVFFFESGRRCATGEGLHTFQSHQAERIFQVVQSKIKIEEYARGQQQGSRASSVASNRNGTASTRQLHPVQRFSSEGANTSFMLMNHAQGAAVNAIYQAPMRAGMATSHYGGFYDHNQGAGSIRQRLPSSSSTHSAAVSEVSGRFTAPMGERPRSVVSAVEQSVYGIHHPSLRAGPTGYLNPSTSSSVMVGSAHSAFHQPAPVGSNLSYYPTPYQQQQQQSVMNRSFMSTMTASTTTAASTPTPQQQQWASQQHLQLVHPITDHHGGHIDIGGIVQQSHLASTGRRYAPHRKQPLPIPPLMASASSNHQFQPVRPPVAARHQPRFQDHLYVNVDMMPGAGALQPRELHRTSKSKQEFLSSQPGGPLYNSSSRSSNPMTTSASAALITAQHHSPASLHGNQGTTSKGFLTITMSAQEKKPLSDSISSSKISLPSTIGIATRPVLNYALLDLEKTGPSYSKTRQRDTNPDLKSAIVGKAAAGTEKSVGFRQLTPLGKEKSPNANDCGAITGQSSTMGVMMVKKE